MRWSGTDVRHRFTGAHEVLGQGLGGGPLAAGAPSSYAALRLDRGAGGGKTIAGLARAGARRFGGVRSVALDLHNSTRADRRGTKRARGSAVALTPNRAGLAEVTRDVLAAVKRPGPWPGRDDPHAGGGGPDGSASTRNDHATYDARAGRPRSWRAAGGPAPRRPIAEYARPTRDVDRPVCLKTGVVGGVRIYGSEAFYGRAGGIRRR